MPPSICASTRQRIDRRRRSRPRRRRGARGSRPSSTETSATCATIAAERLVHRDAARACPSGSGLPQPPSRPRVRARARVADSSRSSARRNATGSLLRRRAPARRRSSRSTNAVCEWPTERHHSTGTGLFGECSSTRCVGIASRYGESAAPSTEVSSMPSLIIIGSNGVPARIDWPTMRVLPRDRLAVVASSAGAHACDSTSAGSSRRGCRPRASRRP